MTDGFRFKTDGGSAEEKFSDLVKNRYLVFLLILMAAIIAMAVVTAEPIEVIPIPTQQGPVG